MRASITLRTLRSSGSGVTFRACLTLWALRAGIALRALRACLTLGTSVAGVSLGALGALGTCLALGALLSGRLPEDEVDGILRYYGLS